MDRTTRPSPPCASLRHHRPRSLQVHAGTQEAGAAADQPLDHALWAEALDDRNLVAHGARNRPAVVYTVQTGNAWCAALLYLPHRCLAVWRDVLLADVKTP